MKSIVHIPLRTLCITLLAATAIARGKPPATPKEPAKKPAAALTPMPSPEPAAGAAIARWLAGADVVALPFADVVQACSGKTVVPFDPANPVDAAMLAKIGAAMDNLLPHMNRPESSAHVVASLNDPEIIARQFENELSAALRPPPGAGAATTTASGGYPAFSLSDPTTGKTYHLAVTLYPTGGDPHGKALSFQPDTDANRFVSDGCCLLIGVEHNGKTGRDLAFLNWQVLDLAKLQVRFAPTYRAEQPEALRPDRVLTDGRKGRD